MMDGKQIVDYVSDMVCDYTGSSHTARAYEDIFDTFIERTLPRNHYGLECKVEIEYDDNDGDTHVYVSLDRGSNLCVRIKDISSGISVVENVNIY